MMLTLTKKAALIGLGLSECFRETVSELEKKGEESQSENGLRLKRLLETLEKGGDECRQKKDALCTRFLDKIRRPNREDINRLEREVSHLSEQFRRWEGTQGKTEAAS